MGKYDELVAGLKKTANVLRIQADLSRRLANTYEPERERWEAEKGDDRLTAMVRYQIEQEQLAKSLSKDAEEAEEAATTITTLEAELAAMKARGDRLVEALNLAANRLHRCCVDYETGTQQFIEVGEWAAEAREALTQYRAMKEKNDG